MGCSGSKDRTKEKQIEPQGTAAGGANRAGGGGAAAAKATPPQRAADVPSSARSADVPVGRAASAHDGSAANHERSSSTAAPGANGPRRAAGDAASQKHDVDEHGDPIVLPKGDWVKTEGTPYYYSATENLYYHPPSWQFYDPTNSMWYDPEKNEWYHDDGDDD